ncbi:MAG TPA: TIGR02186 family protein [Alphaproteobacteria bacterium]|nr:TIGR02186 family protein [Alphaproteobacteria bacterium]
MRASLLVLAVLAWVASVAGGRIAVAASLVADLSDHLIAITTGFTGTDVLLFGAKEGPGEVVMIVRGPIGAISVRKKSRIAGIWMNTDRVTFSNVPSFYTVASSALLADIAPPSVLARHQIGFDQLKLQAPPNVEPDRLRDFRAALIRRQQRAGLFMREVGEVSFLGNTLFRSTVHFPANVPVGVYLVEVLLLQDRNVTGAQTTPLIISKVGFGAELFDFAHQRAALYGLIAILIALVSGWLPHILLRKA